MVEIQFPNGVKKYVIFTEIQTMDLTDSAKEYELDSRYDLIAICFEHSNYLKKFMQEKHLFMKYPVPKIGLMCKNDERQFDRKSLETKDFADMGLRMFAECSSKHGEYLNFTFTLMKVIETPYAVP